ncbi:MAG: hypothetical protein KC643_25275 [Nitrospira sp.]|nr:hypothetical protein [Nitrospira sp.]MCB9710453.1 hypothetical protein [Nitrospiraceae bacterium]
MDQQKSQKIASITNPVPLDMIEAWLRGEYLIGQNESTGYEFLGWALMLRGAYVYVVIPESEQPNLVVERVSHWGICTIDIKDGDLTYQGIRLHTLKQTLPKSQQYWHSIFSKLTLVPSSTQNTPDAYFAYVMDELADNFWENRDAPSIFKRSQNDGKATDNVVPIFRLADQIREMMSSWTTTFDMTRKNLMGEDYKQETINNLESSLRNFVSQGEKLLEVHWNATILANILRHRAQGNDSSDDRQFLAYVMTREPCKEKHDQWEKQIEGVKTYIRENFEQDLTKCKNTGKTKDKVVAIAHINLEEWGKNNTDRKSALRGIGHFQPVLSSDKAQVANQLPQPGTIYFYSL